MRGGSPVASRSIEASSSSRRCACAVTREGVRPGRHQLRADAVARVALVAVARVIDEALIARDQGLSQAVRGHTEPGAAEALAMALEGLGHGGQAGQAGTAREREQHGLGLVVAVLREQHPAKALSFRQFGQRAVTREPGGVLRALAGGVPRVHPGHEHRHAQGGGELAHAGLEAIGRVLQAVVHVQRHAPARPARVRGQQQGHRVGPAAAGDADRRDVLIDGVPRRPVAELVGAGPSVRLSDGL
jgi:hypothetical protein